MLKIYLVICYLILVGTDFIVQQDKIAKTPDGQMVILRKNGKWLFVNNIDLRDDKATSSDGHTVLLLKDGRWLLTNTTEASFSQQNYTFQNVQVSSYKKVYFHFMEDPFNVDEAELVRNDQLVNCRSIEENNWRIMCLAQIERMHGYKVGYLIHRNSYDRKNIIEAYNILSKITDDVETKMYLLLDKSITFIILGCANDVIRILDAKLNEEAKKDNSIQLAYGLAYFMRSDNVNSEIHLLQSLKSPKSKWEAWWANRYLGIIYDKQGKYAEAEQYLRDNINLNPDYPYFYEHLASYFYNHQRYDEALLVVEKGLQLGQYPVLIALSDKIKKCR
jgi:tetratricopeptide (TPR) repeat protein